MNIPLISGQIALLHVKLETDDDFELYGGTTKAGFSITPERPDAKNEWLVTIDETLVAGKPLTRFDVYVRQISSGREWVVLSGKLLVSPRSAGVDADKLAPIEYNVTIPVVENAVDLTGAAIVTGIPGPRGWSAYEIAVQNGFEGSEPEWLEYMRQQTATLAVEQVTPLMERSETAADKSESEASAAKTEQETAAAHAKAAKESEIAAAEHKTAAAGEVTKAAAEVTKASAEVEKAKQERETAAGHAAAAATSAKDALANKQDAEQAAQDAARAQAGAEQAKAEVDAAKTEAQTAESNAKASANAAAADKTAAEQAKADAQAAQTKAEQEAAKAEQNAALLGDAALKGADNTFTGLNTFAGEVVGVLPWDFFAYSWCRNKEELWAACPDIEQRRVFCADLSNFEDITQPNNGDGIILPNNIWKACLFFTGDVKGKYTLGRGLNEVYIYAPNAQSYGRIRYMAHVTNAVIYVPNAKTDGAAVLFDRMTVINLTLVCKNTKMDNWTINGYGYAATSMKTLRCPLNILQTVNLADYKVLQDVPCGFPHATLINLNAAKLNKASVMAILNDLKPYDTTTMPTVPELSIGIDPALDGDEEINAALLNAQESVENGGKGWNVAVAGFTVTAGGGATMGLRKPIYAQRRAAADGAYIDAAGTRWSVRYGNTVLENWAANEELGYTEFPSLEAALEEWGLTEYVPDVPDETLTNE